MPASDCIMTQRLMAAPRTRNARLKSFLPEEETEVELVGGMVIVHF